MGAQLAQLRAQTPAALAEGSYSVRIALTDSGGRKTVTLSPFLVYDGLAPKVVGAIRPATVPTVVSAGGRVLEMQTKVSAILANFPQDLSPTQVTLNPEPSTLTPKP